MRRAGNRHAVVFSDLERDASTGVSGSPLDDQHMQAPEGYFYYRDLGWTKIRTPMFHWGQGTMFKALAHLMGKLRFARRRGPGRRPNDSTALSYVLITPARNEEAFIENTLGSVEAQTAGRCAGSS